MDKAEAIAKAKEYRKLLERHLSFESMYLFGSFATGKFRDDSDIDLAIIVSRMPDDYLGISHLLWQLRHEIDVRIEPVLVDKAEDPTGFYSSIIQSGIAIN